MNSKPDPALQQWLAVKVGDLHLALSVTWVVSVFRSVLSDSNHSSSVIDVAVHAGAPVFITPSAYFFNEPKQASDRGAEPAPWVVVWHKPENPLMGFRVEWVKGPFHAVVNNDSVNYEGVDWKVPSIKQVPHA
jgi:hypothetical protein